MGGAADIGAIMGAASCGGKGTAARCTRVQVVRRSPRQPTSAPLHTLQYNTFHLLWWPHHLWWWRLLKGTCRHACRGWASCGPLAPGAARRYRAMGGFSAAQLFDIVAAADVNVPSRLHVGPLLRVLLGAWLVLGGSIAAAALGVGAQRGVVFVHLGQHKAAWATEVHARAGLFVGELVHTSVDRCQ